MLTRKYSILAAAVLAATTPLVGKAATIAFAYDPADFSVSQGTFTLGGTATAPTITITGGAGTVVSLGVDVTVSDPNSTIAYHGAYDSTPTSGAHHFIQPQNLGLASFGYGFNTSDTTNAPLDPSGVVLNTTGSLFGGSTGTGSENNTAGDVDLGTITGNGLAANISATTAAAVGPLSYGSTTADLFSGLNVDVNAQGTGSYTITPNTQNGYFAYVAYNSGGTNSTLKPTYKNVTVTGTDTVTNLPALTIILAGATSSTTVSSHAIISLTAGTAAVANYGNADGSLTMTGVGNGSYNVAHDTAFTTSATASVPVTGFNPATDKEIYALKLSLPNGVTDAAVIADINGGGTNVGAVGVTASAVTGVYSTLFPGYDILLTSVSGFTATGGASLGFDFTADTTAADAGITVTGVAAVPEPATAAGIVLGAAGLLLGRRRNKAVVA
jgi:hypothetical protein